MNSKLLRRVKFITGIFIFLLVLEVFYVIYSLFINNTVNLYFDSINAIDSNSSYYITVGSNNNNDNYYEKAKLTKYNKKREKIDEKLFNVGYNSVFFGVTIDNDSIIVVGSYEKNKDDHNNSIRRGIIVKYDENGEEEFFDELSLLDNSKYTNVVNVEDGYIVSGQSVYKSTKIGNKSGGAILSKYDKNGKLIWNKTYGDNKEAIFNDLLVYDNYIYAVGVDKNNKGIICKYDINGNLIHDIKYDDMDSTGFRDILYLNNYLYVVGSNNTNALIGKYDLDCNCIGEVVYKNNSDTRYNKIISDNDDSIIVIGTIMKNKNNNNKTIDSFDYDGIIGKYNSDLEEISIVTYGEQYDDYFTDIKYIDNSYLVVGFSSYEDGSYMSKFIRYSDALKVLEVN